MWWLLFSFVLLPSFASAQVILNEVYYDHPGSDDGYEFVELINPDPRPISLTGYSLEFQNGATAVWTSIWRAGSSDSIPPAGLFVIGGERVDPPPDALLSATLENGPDAVRLSRDGVVVDRLGYGPLSDASAYEGESAPDVPAGSSLGRRPDGFDSDNNAVDFAPMTPSPGRFNVPRRDVRLAAGPETPTKRILREAQRDAIRIRLFNSGLDTVRFGEVVVELTDSTAGGVRALDSAANRSAMAPGESLQTIFEISLHSGYHRLTARALYSPDERPRDNAAEFLRRVGEFPILVSEVMSHPRSGCPEYVELHNGGVLSYDVSGLSFGDAAHPPVSIPAEKIVVNPRDFLVLTPDRAGLMNCFSGLESTSVVEVGPPWPALNHTGAPSADSVIVLDGWGLEIDRIGYPPQPSATRGRSLERVTLYRGGGDVWVLSPDPRGGTPGRPYHGALAERPVGDVAVSPNPFAPADGEILRIDIPARGALVRAVVSIFDIRGRRVRHIGSAARLPFVFLWDGRGDDGGVVAPGLYVLACEYRPQNGGKGRVERVVVGCGKKIR